MFFIFPLFFLLFFSFIARRYLDNWRAAILFASVVTATALTGITEGLSLVHCFSFYPLLFIWLLLIAIIVKLLSVKFNIRSYPFINFSNWFFAEKILLVLILCIIVVSFLTAAVSAPNTWDSMTYHLARVEHWIQNKTIAFYPTHLIRQLYITPWAEFAIAQVRILGGGDTSANFIQWMSMAGSLIGVSLIAGQLGAGRIGQLLSVLISASLPMGILQSVSTQTDYVGSFWLIVFVYFIIENNRAFSLIHVLAVGLSLGLALLTKGSSYVFAIPFFIWFLVINFKKRLMQGIIGFFFVIACVIGLNMGQYLRVSQTFGSSAQTVVNLTNSSFDLKVLWVNVLRNASIHLGSPWNDINENTTNFLTKAAQAVGADINDPRASYSQDFAVNSLRFDEDYSGNFLHVVLFAIVFILFWFYRGDRLQMGLYLCCVVISFLLFCLILRFQPWHSRFHLTLFILFSPLAGALLEYFLKQKSIVIAIVLFLGALPWVFLNDQHPWFGNLSIWKEPRIVQYFYKRPYLAQPIVATTSYLKSIDCRQIGLIMGEDTWEYPWWVLLSGKHLRIEHVEVTNASGVLKYPLGNFQPCAIIATDVHPPAFVMLGNAVYGPAGSVPAGGDKITIFLKKF